MRKKINVYEEKISFGALLIITILFIFGLYMLISTNIFSITNIQDLQNYLLNNGFVAIISIFFIIISIYCYIYTIKTFLSKPKNEVLYLLNKETSNDDQLNTEDTICQFIDKKGKTFFYKDNNYEIAKYYNVVIKNDTIISINNISNGSFEIPEIKKSYWLNFYSPMGNFENLLLLPIVYTTLLIGIVNIIVSYGFSKLFGLIFCVPSLYLIIYDIIYKISLKKNKEFDDSHLKDGFLRIMTIFKNTILISTVLFINIVFFYLFFKTEDIVFKIILSFFCACTICLLGATIFNMLSSKKIENIFMKGYIVIFLTYWFGLLAYSTIQNIKDGFDLFTILITVPFWIVGFVVLYIFIFNKDNDNKKYHS